MSIAEMEARRGQPVLFLGLLIVGWLLLRAVLWEGPRPLLPLPDLGAGPTAGASASGRETDQVADNPALLAKTGHALAGGSSVPQSMQRYAVFTRSMDSLPDEDTRVTRRRSIPPRPQARRSDGAGGGFQAEDLNAEPVTSVAVQPPRSRWSVDTWLFLREGGSDLLSGSAARPATYGASQAGAVVSYHLVPGSAHEPAIYGRVTKALVRDGETDAAIGLRVRPVTTLPVTAHAEVRATRSVAGTAFRPAAFLAAGAEEVPIIGGLEAGGYVQAGYVSGDFSTGFADGRVTITKTVTRSDQHSFTLGVGGWGGVQKDAERVDFGPTLAVKLPVLDTTTRLTVDYRFRLAGNAQPNSGVAITLSSGF